MSRILPKRRRVVAVDLFCGIGGNAHGLIQSGISVVAGVDIDPTCRYGFESNNQSARFVESDARKLSPGEIASWYPENSYRVLVGCAPCQPFSVYSYRYGAADKARRSRDSRWGLLRVLSDAATSILPDVVAIENVPQLAEQNHRVYRDFIRALESVGYAVSSSIVKCADYGVPQTRTRLVVLASRLGPISLRPPTHDSERVTIRHAIGHLRRLNAGEVDDCDPLHRSPSLSKTNLLRIQSTPEGGSWRDWPKRLQLQCHQRSTGQTYPSVYGRMSWQSLGPTITTQCYGLGNGRFGHPEQDRAISLREAAILQTFPEDYKFARTAEEITFKHVGKHIGNAVPVLLAKAIGESIMSHVRARGRAVAAG